MDLKKREKERVALEEPIKLSGLKVAMLQGVIENPGISLKGLRDVVNKKLGTEISLPYFSQSIKELEHKGIIARERTYPHYIYVEDHVMEPLQTYLNALMRLTRSAGSAEAKNLLKQRMEIDERLKTIAPATILRSDQG